MASGSKKKRVSRIKLSRVIDTRVIYCGDNLDYLKKMPDNCVDLIYIDPPFNSNRNYEVFWGEEHEGRSFEDRHANIQAYLDFMRPRCIELSRVLKLSGSFYYHCDWHASHYVKVMLDQIFGQKNFLNNIVWCYGLGGSSPRYFPRKHDDIFFYSNGDDRNRYFDPPMMAATSNRLKGRQKKCPDNWNIPSLNNMSKERIGYPTQKPLELLERIVRASSKPNDIVLDAFCGCGTTSEASEKLNRQWIGIDLSPTACRVMAKRIFDNCHLKEDEALWKVDRGFIVRDLPWTEEKLRKLKPFEFENWAIIALSGVPNKTQVGDMGIDGKIYPVSSVSNKGATGEQLTFTEDLWYPVQVKQKPKAGRPDIDSFEAAMMRSESEKGFFVAFDYTRDAMQEIRRFKKQTGREIVAVKVAEILDEVQRRKWA